jgi:hypothetical protein
MLLLFLGHSLSWIPSLRWASPQNSAWGNVDPSTTTSLPFTLVAENLFPGQPGVLEYRIDDLSGPWTPFSPFASGASPAHDGSIVMSGSFDVKDLPLSAGKHFIEARWDGQNTRTDGVAAYYYAGHFPLFPPNLSFPEGGRSRIRRVPAAGLTATHLPFRLQVGEDGPLVQIAYRIGNDGTLHYAGDFKPGIVDVAIPTAMIPVGRDSTISFNAWNGVATSPETADVTLSFNSPPHISLTDTRPLSFHGSVDERVALPVSVEDSDDKVVHVMYSFDGEDFWKEVLSESGRHFLPAEAFEGRLTPGEHTIDLQASDEIDRSADTLSVRYSFDDSEEGDLGPLSVTGLVLIIVGAVTLIGLVIAILMNWKRRKESSNSSTGLIESE